MPDRQRQPDAGAETDPPRSGRPRVVLVVVAVGAVGAVAAWLLWPSSSTEEPRAEGPGTTAAAEPTCGTGTAADPEVQVFGDGPTPEVLWSLPVGGIDADADEIDGIAVDDDGNVAIAGVFRGEVDIGDTVFESSGEGDVFVASIAPDATVRWAHRFGGTGDDNAYDLKVDGDGNVLISGWFTGEVDFGGVELASAGRMDMFVAKLSTDGEVDWARAFGGELGDGGNEIAVLPDGEIAVSLITEGDVVIDGETHRHGGGMRDSYVLRLDADGDVRWVHHFDGTGNERIRAIAIGDDAHVAVGFQYRNELRSGATSLRSRGGWDGALARLTPDGDLDWMLPVGGAGTDNTRGVGIGPDGTIYASGVVEGAAFVLDRDLPAPGGATADYVAAVSPDGDPSWLVTFEGPGLSVGTELRTDGRGVVVSALLDGQVTVQRDDEELAEVSPRTDLPTSYAAALDADGGLRFIHAPSPQPPDGGAFGDVLGVSFDGEHLAQALRFRGTLSVAGNRMTTASRRDSAIIFTCLATGPS